MTEYSIGIDIGGTKIAAGIVSQSGQMVHRVSVPTPKMGRVAILERIESLIASLSEYARQHSLAPVVGIGIGTAGQVDFAHGRVQSGTINIRDWNDVPLRDHLASSTSLPVWVDNDVNVLALAEAHLGAAQGETDVICLALGTGVGGGVISDGRMVHGAWGSAAELGHVSVDMNGPMCNCGTRGCLELYASGTGIARMMQEKLARNATQNSPSYEHFILHREDITSRQVFEWMRTGDAIAREVVDTMVYALSVAMVGFIHAFNPTMVVMGGGVMQDGAWLLQRVEESTKCMGLQSLVRPVKFRLAELGPDAGLLGAAYQSWVYQCDM